MLLLYFSSIQIFFFPFFLLHGDSLLYKCKYFLVALQILAVLVYILVLHLLPCCLADLPGDCSVVIHLWILNKIGSNLETRLNFTKWFSLAKQGMNLKYSQPCAWKQAECWWRGYKHSRGEKCFFHSCLKKKKKRHDYLNFQGFKFLILVILLVSQSCRKLAS